MAASSTVEDLPEDNDYFFNNKNDEFIIYNEDDIEKMVDEDVKVFIDYIATRKDKDQFNPDFKKYYVTATMCRENGMPFEVGVAMLMDIPTDCLHILYFFRAIFGKFRGTTMYLEIRDLNPEAVFFPDIVNAMQRTKMVVDKMCDDVDKSLFERFQTLNQTFMEKAVMLNDPDHAIEVVERSINESMRTMEISLEKYLRICPHLKGDALVMFNTAMDKLRQEMFGNDIVTLGSGKRIRSE